MLVPDKKKYIALLLILCSGLMIGQTTIIDSLKTKLKEGGDHIELAHVNLLLAKQYERVDLKLAVVHANRSLEYQENDSLVAEAFNQLGRSYFLMRQLDSAAVYFKKAKDKLLKLNNRKGAAVVEIGIAAILLRQGNYNATIKTMTRCACFFEEDNDLLNAAKCYNNMATAFAELENFQKAIQFSEKALNIFSDKGLTQYELITLPNLAAQHAKNGDTIKAIRYNLDAEKLAIEMNNKRSLSIIYNNLGSKMATLKLYIEEVWNNADLDSSEKDKLLRKLKYLADESYKEVRSIAHNKNTKSCISQGLVLATQAIADQISMSNQLSINVINIDVDEFISGMIEIQVFRSIQELMTNIIKHADASEVNIQFSKDEALMLVMIEDNGRGFMPEKVARGMGLQNIEKRMDKISGSINIDSSPGNGTTVILSVPVSA